MCCPNGSGRNYLNPLQEDSPGMVIIRVSGVSKTFSMDQKQPSRGRQRNMRLDVLKDISFEVREGESVGIIGKNGSGKTTLLQLLAGILTPDSGVIEIKGRILPLLDIQTGIDDEFTGREGIFLMGAIHGLSGEDIYAMLPRVIAFCGLGEFLDVRVKQYSAGMKMRLALATALEIPHDILLLDEVSAVGDEEFQKKCISRLEELRLQGKTFVIVSHQMDEVVERCDQVIFLDGGKIVAQGPPIETTQLYISHMITHHLHTIKRDIRSRLTRLQGISPSNRVFEKRLGPFGTLRKWVNGNTAVSEYHEAIEGLRTMVKGFECLVNVRTDYLMLELDRLQDEYFRQEKNSRAVPSRESDCPSKYHEVEQELRRMLEEKRFLLTVKIQMGLDSSALAHERHQLKAGIGALLNTQTGTDNDALRRMHLELLQSQLDDNRPVEALLPTIRDYAGTCCEMIRAESDPASRERTLRQFLNTIRGKFSEAASGELWIVERLLDITPEVFMKDVLSPVEGIFLPEYVRMAKYALAAFDEVPPSRIDCLGHLLREGLGVVEHELLTISLRESPDDERQRRLSNIKGELLRGLSELYNSSGANPRPQGSGWGFGDAEITSVSIGFRDKTEGFRTSEPFQVAIRYVRRKKLDDGIRVGITIHHESGLPLLAQDTIVPDDHPADVEGEVRFSMSALPLTPGRYLLSAALYDPLLTKPYDHHHQAYDFIVEGKSASPGLLEFDNLWTVRNGAPPSE